MRDRFSLFEPAEAPTLQAPETGQFEFYFSDRQSRGNTLSMLSEPLSGAQSCDDCHMQTSPRAQAPQFASAVGVRTGDSPWEYSRFTRITENGKGG